MSKSEDVVSELGAGTRLFNMDGIRIWLAKNFEEAIAEMERMEGKKWQEIHDELNPPECMGKLQKVLREADPTSFEGVCAATALDRLITGSNAPFLVGLTPEW